MHRSTLTILFQDPFWIGLYEREEDGRYQVCRIVFGAEPRDQEVYQGPVKIYAQNCFAGSG